MVLEYEWFCNKPEFGPHKETQELILINHSEETTNQAYKESGRLQL